MKNTILKVFPKINIKFVLKVSYPYEEKDMKNFIIYSEIFFAKQWVLQLIPQPYFSVSHHLEVNDMALYCSRVYHFFCIHYAPILH